MVYQNHTSLNDRYLAENIAKNTHSATSHMRVPSQEEMPLIDMVMKNRESVIAEKRPDLRGIVAQRQFVLKIIDSVPRNGALPSNEEILTAFDYAMNQGQQSKVR